MRTLVFLTLAVIIGATLIANFGLGDRAFFFLRYIPGGDTTGHFGLYGLLGYAIGAWGRRSATWSKRWIWIVVAVGVLVSAEELSQAFISTRTFSLVDLFASLVGLGVGSAVSVWPLREA